MEQEIGGAMQAIGHAALKVSWFQTPIGRMVVIADETALYRLEFSDQSEADELNRLRVATKSEITPGRTAITASIERELAQYFAGTLTAFKTPCYLNGSPFQQNVWQELQKIPFGTTCAYADLARTIGKPTAFRAVAQANRLNPLAIIVPCHRVIYADGSLGGYAGGLTRKAWLLNHENNWAGG